MKNVYFLTNKNYHEYISKIQYGSNLVHYTSSDVQINFLGAIEVVNEMLGGSHIRETIYEEGDIYDHQFVSQEITGVFNILCAWRGELPSLTLDDLDIRRNAAIAKNDKWKKYFHINASLFKFAKRVAFNEGIKFGSDVGGQYFDASAKIWPVMKQIQNAYHEGLDKIEFNSKRHSAATMRCYASTLAAQTVKKIRCKITAEKIIITFKEPTAHQMCVEKIEELWNETVLRIGFSDAEDAFKDVVAKHISKPEAAEAQPGNDTAGHDDDAAEKIPEPVDLVLDEKSNQFFIPGTEPESKDQDDEAEEW